MPEIDVVLESPVTPEVYDFVRIRKGHVQPPSVYFVTRDDKLELLTWSPITDTTVQLSLRFMGPDGQVLPRYETWVTNHAASQPQSKVFDNAQGYLISASISTPGAPRGQCFVSMQIKRGGGSQDATFGDVFLQGYPGSAGSISYPQTPVQSALGGRGRMRSIVAANPGAGNNWSQVVPAGVNWILRAVTAEFAASATVANRVLTLKLGDGTNILAVVPGPTVTAGLTDFLTWSPAPLFSSTTGTGVTLAIPPEWRMQPGWLVEVVTAAIDASDVWSNIVLTVEEFVAD